VAVLCIVMQEKNGLVKKHHQDNKAVGLPLEGARPHLDDFDG